MTNHTNLIERLKPCGHCGAGGYLHEADFEIVAVISIGCEKCGAMGPFIDVEGDKPTEADWVKAAEAWNTRTNDQAISTLTAEVEELRAERDALLQRPIDLALMDSIDDDATAKMIAYYWYEQAQEARATPTKGEGL